MSDKQYYDTTLQYSLIRLIYACYRERIWTIRVYNAYSRLNPFTYYFQSNPEFGELPNGEFGLISNNTSLVKVALFPIIITPSFQFKF